MTLQVFLEFLYKNKKLPDTSVICFLGKEYHILFFFYIISFLNKHGHKVEHVDNVGTDLSLIKAHISTMSFSGQVTYWLNDIYTLTAKKQQEWLMYMQSYMGPHTVLFFSTEESMAAQLEKNNNCVAVVLPHHIPSHDFSHIRFLMSESASHNTTSFSSKVASYTQSISLDTACLFAHYEVLLGKNIEDFFREWIVHLVEPTHSLFLLSQYFFSKKARLFFEQWSLCESAYQPSFWATFWADQVWRAYIYCDLMKQKNYTQAKKAQYKLPFSLINRDWSSLHSSELRNAHQFLSQMDFRLKNGGSSVALELFYGKFFDNSFR